MKDFIIGIDPSLTCTGIVVLDRNLKLVKAQPVTSKPPQVRSWRTAVARREAVNLAILSYLAEHDGRQIILVEDYAALTYTNSAIPTIELGASLRTSFLLLERTKPVQVEFVAPSVMKKFIAGNGNASKAQVAAAIRKHYKVDFGDNDDLFDAYGLARLLGTILKLDAGISLSQFTYAQQVRDQFSYTALA